MTLVRIENPNKELHLRGLLKQKYDWVAGTLGADLATIEARLNEMIDGDRIHTAGWLPGSDWTNTPFQKIYEVCGGDEEEAAKCLGLIVWKVFEKRQESWASAHGMVDGKEIRSRTYFRWPTP